MATSIKHKQTNVKHPSKLRFAKRNVYAMRKGNYGQPEEIFKANRIQGTIEEEILQARENIEEGSMQFEGTEEFIDRWRIIDIEKIDSQRVDCNYCKLDVKVDKIVFKGLRQVPCN